MPQTDTENTRESLANLKTALDTKVLLERVAEIRYREEHYGSSVGGRTVDADKQWLCDQLKAILGERDSLREQLELTKQVYQCSIDARDEMLKRLRQDLNSLCEQLADAYRIDWPDRLKQAVAAERGRCAEAICIWCQKGKPFSLEFPDVHEWLDDTGHGLAGCRATLIRRLPIKEARE